MSTKDWRFTLVDRLRERVAEQSRAEARRFLEDDLRALWREACTGVGLCQTIDAAAGPTVRTPRFGGLRGGAGLTFSTELLPGQEPEDLRAHATRLAHTLGAHGLRVEPLAGRWLRVVLLHADPLTARVPLPALPLAHGAGRLVLGRAEDGSALTHRLTDPAHLAVQGQNGSGKSVFTYGLLAQLAAASDVLITGSDITGLVLGRAFTGTAHREYQATGTRDLLEHAAMLDRLVAEMDHRLDAMPARQDSITPTTTTPTVLVVLEEFPGLLRAAQAKDKKLAERITSTVLRLVSEGRKAAFRVLMLAQRFEANAVGGGYARDQFALRLSFRVPADSLVMLHGEDVRPLGPQHANAAPGIAYLSGPGRDCLRMRAPYLGGYGEFCDRITRDARRPTGETWAEWTEDAA
jgi:S-DNA-T family DNA segregation ATPase FtsK/SpoIIIE